MSLHNQQDKKLIIDIAYGDEAAFAVLYKIYYQKLYRFLYKTFNDREEIVDDIIQEAFLRIWLNREKLLEIENVQAWIYKIVSTESLTHIRKELHLKTKSDRLHQYLTQTNNTYKNIRVDFPVHPKVNN